ncbi:MAG TPA: type IX secretion system membrane protein PorP/SprF, partial [Chryseolinea sp.]|nr:type IX secretion system membrane protein PorP/SprF [Chryseolinea sp.]
MNLERKIAKYSATPKHLIPALLLVSVMAAQVTRAQENPLYSQYMFNGLVINPAYTGSQESLV